MSNRTSKERVSFNNAEKMTSSIPSMSPSVQIEEKHHPIPPIPTNYRLSIEQMPIHYDFNEIGLVIRGGCLFESSKGLDTILVWLTDIRTASLFNFKLYPVLFNVIYEQYISKMKE